MSSKSRKHSQSGKKRPSTAADPLSGPASAVARQGEPGSDEHEELLHAPKEVSKLKFALMILLVVFLLVVFTIGDSIMGVMGGGQGGADTIAFRWQRTPGAPPEEVSYQELVTFHRELESAMRLDRVMQFSMFYEGGDEPTRADAARVLVLSRLAEDTGVRVPDADLGEYLSDMVVRFSFGGDVEQYRATIRTPDFRGFEETIRTCLVAQRYLMLLGYAASYPSADDIVEEWNLRHEEVEFEYLAVDAAEFEEAARTELPDDAGLEAWFEELPPSEKIEYEVPERRTVELALYQDPESTPAAGLLEKYPDTTERTPEERASDYYSAVYFMRFPKPVEEGEQPSGYLSQEEVLEQCSIEAPIYFAMQSWLDDLRARTEAGEEVDFAAETAALGLGLEKLENVTREELLEREDLGDSFFANSVFSTGADGFSAQPTWAAGVAGLAHLVERTEASLPPFAKIRDQVADAWVEPRAEELAVDHATSLWSELEAFELPEDSPIGGLPGPHRRADAERFRALAEGGGFEVHVREYVDRGAKKDPGASEGDTVREYLWNRRFDVGRMELDQVARPELEDGVVYMVRVSGKREVPVDRMSPRDYEGIESSARVAMRRRLLETTDLDYLRTHFALVEAEENALGTMKDEEAQPEPAPENEAGGGEAP